MKKSKIRRLGIWCAVLLCVSALIAGAVYGYWATFEHRFFTVTENEVYRSGAMPIETLKNKTQKYKIKTVIDLRRLDEKVKIEHAALAKMGVRHFSVPAKQVPTKETVKAFLDIMDDKKNRPVLIHCHHGEGRAVLFSAIYRIEYEGWPNDQARRASRLILYKSSFSADSKKGMFLKNYIPRFHRND